MTRLTFDEIYKRFSVWHGAAHTLGDPAIIARTASYCEALDAMRDWPDSQEDFVNAVNRYREAVDAIGVYMVYAPRIKEYPDPILETLLASGARDQEEVFKRLGDKIDYTLRDVRRDIVDALTRE